jgi:hypothetical protein
MDLQLYLFTVPLDFDYLHFYLYEISTTAMQMSDDNPYVIPEMDPTLRKQIQQCNWQIVNVTTPANYFHVLRRQVKILTALPFTYFLESHGSNRYKVPSNVCFYRAVLL